jgi:hypothetical protein
MVGGRFGFPGERLLSIGDWELQAGWFILLFLAIWLSCLGTVLLLPRGLSRRRSATAILLLALGCRLLLLPHPHSDDLNRYIWEGTLLAAGMSPYSHAPIADDDPVADALRDADDPNWRGINHPTMTAIYPPLALAGFALLSTVSESPLLVKAVMTGFDLATLVLLLLLLRDRRLDARWALLYGVNPIILFSFAGQGHLDAVQGLLILATVLLYRRRRWAWMFLMAGLALHVKYVALLGWPLLLRRENLRWAWIAPLTAGIPLLPPLYFDPRGLFNSLLAFGYEFAFNGPLHQPLQWLVENRSEATQICQVLLGAVVLFGYWWCHPTRSGARQPDPSAGWFFVLGAALILSPTVHFWYLSWILPLLALLPCASWTVLSGTAAFSFVATGYLHFEGAWRYPPWAIAAVWALPLLLLVREMIRGWRRARGGECWPVPHNVSVVIPTLNETANIAACIEAARGGGAVHEIIVVDGGSSDNTQVIAAEHGARVVVHERPLHQGGGRGGQIVAGCREAEGDLVVVLHADTRVERDCFNEALQLLVENPEIVGGAFGCVFDNTHWRFCLLETANDLRASMIGISFGDQVQFFRRVPVLTHQAVPDIPLFEDVELSLRMHGFGRVGYLWSSSLSSSRRWLNSAPSKALQVIGITCWYLTRRLFGKPDTVASYKRYYK